ncbi:MAG TPA: hypothetical protein VJN64_14395 [Terriglobales bacterium]|nr:hypothetical protein [Terriglobales bacterium]
MADKLKIVLFEDTPASRSVILEALKQHVGQEGDAIAFEQGLVHESADDQEKMYEERLIKILRTEPYKDASLILADRDLSKTVETNFRGLSVNAVAAAAKKLSIPLCSYARGVSVEEYDWRGRWQEEHIVLHLSEGEDELGRRATLAAEGFAHIASEVPKFLNNKSLNSPAALLAAVLGKDEYADKIALYAVGDQNRLPDIPKEGRQAKDLIPRLTLLLGYWLWDSLLRYPGVFVNQIAAGSYLDINGEDFEMEKIQEIFDEGLYDGPFADIKRPQWWRGVLDDIIAHSGCNSGLEFALKKGLDNVRRSECYVDSTKRAGYYCIIAQRPVSLENSKGGLSWFPRGADLTRIGNPKFEEYGPWLGT